MVPSRGTINCCWCCLPATRASLPAAAAATRTTRPTSACVAIAKSHELDRREGLSSFLLPSPILLPPSAQPAARTDSLRCTAFFLSLPQSSSFATRVAGRPVWGAKEEEICPVTAAGHARSSAVEERTCARRWEIRSWTRLCGPAWSMHLLVAKFTGITR
jgi:hypothetical protein